MVLVDMDILSVNLTEDTTVSTGGGTQASFKDIDFNSEVSSSMSGIVGHK